MIDHEHVRLDVVADVAYVTLTRPDSRNAQTPSLWRALAQIGRTLPADVRAVVLRGEGPTFSAGLDRRMFTPEGIAGETSLMSLVQGSDEQVLAAIAEYQEAFTWWRASDAITIAAVQGHAVGAGFQLALACDLIVAHPSARFAMKEATWGLVPDLAGTAPLVEAVGYARALEICTSAREVPADEALRIGLVAAVADDLDSQVAAILAPILANPAGAVSATKHLLRGAQHRHPVAQRQHERDVQLTRLRDLARAMGTSGA